MRKISTFAIALLMGATMADAQTVATFDTLTLVGTDTFYVNYSNPGNDVGFDDGLAHFECVYDTAFGFKSLAEGFVYSNMTDSVTGTYMNPNSAKTAKGYSNSAQYLVGFAYNGPIFATLKGKAKGKPVKGFYITNSTFAYETMKKGDGFAKKFGGVPNTEPDWFKLTIKGFLNGTKKPDSVNFYLADFRSADSTQDYIVKTWEWLNLLPLGNVDSLTFELSSTDTAGGFGMNNPAYFCMDNFEKFETSSVPALPANYVAKVYPNPFTDKLFIEVNDESINEIIVTDMGGKIAGRFKTTDNKVVINTANYIPGVYLVQLSGTNGVASTRFVKQ